MFSFHNIIQQTKLFPCFVVF